MAFSPIGKTAQQIKIEKAKAQKPQEKAAATLAAKRADYIKRAKKKADDDAKKAAKVLAAQKTRQAAFGPKAKQDLNEQQAKAKVSKEWASYMSSAEGKAMLDKAWKESSRSGSASFEKSAEGKAMAKKMADKVIKEAKTYKNSSEGIGNRNKMANEVDKKAKAAKEVVDKANAAKEKQARSDRLNGKVPRPTGNQNPNPKPQLSGSTFKPGAKWIPKPGSGMEPKSVETVKATKEWVSSKEGQAMLDLAMTIGLDKAGPIDSSIAAATSFMDGVMGRKKALMTIGQKLTDKKAMANGREAAELMKDVSGYVKETSKSLGASITKASKAASGAASAAGDMTDDFVSDAMSTAKKTTSSISSFFKAAKAKATAYVNDGDSDTGGKKESGGGRVTKNMSLQSSIGQLDGASNEQLAKAGLYRVKAFTRSDGVKIKQHYRKISRS